jgi:cell division protein FtsN
VQRRNDVLGKFGLILLGVLFGACMFVAGAMAPAAWRQSIGTLTQRLTGTPDAAATRSILATSGKPATPPGKTPATPAASGSAAPVPLGNLLVSARVAMPAPAKGQPAFALQLGQFARDADADALARRAVAAAPGLPLSRIAGVDTNGQAWTVLAIGRYVSPEEAQRDAARLQENLDLGDLPAIRLPDPAPSAKPGA